MDTSQRDTSGFVAYRGNLQRDHSFAPGDGGPRAGVGWFEQHTPDFRPLWVAERDGHIAGWLSFSTFYGRPAYNKTAELSVYVGEAFRHRGLGSYFLAQAIAHAPAIAVDRLIGFVYGHNHPSLELFARFGFVKWGDLPGVTLLDDIERDVIILGRRVVNPA